MGISILLIIIGLALMAVGILTIIRNVKYMGTIVDEENVFPFCLAFFGLILIAVGIMILVV